MDSERRWQARRALVIVAGVLLIVNANRTSAGEPASAEPPAEIASESVPADEGAA